MSVKYGLWRTSVDGLQQVGQRIADARERAGLTQPDLARTLGVSTQTVSNWERGKHRLSEERLQAIAQVLRTTPAALRYGASTEAGGPSASSGTGYLVAEMTRAEIEAGHAAEPHDIARAEIMAIRMGMLVPHFLGVFSRLLALSDIKDPQVRERVLSLGYVSLQHAIARSRDDYRRIMDRIWGDPSLPPEEVLRDLGLENTVSPDLLASQAEGAAYARELRAMTAEVQAMLNTTTDTAVTSGAGALGEAEGNQAAAGPAGSIVPTPESGAQSVIEAAETVERAVREHTEAPAQRPTRQRKRKQG